MRKQRKLNNKGFTIIELMVALSVLSVLLVITTVTLIQIGKLFSKGVNSAAVQNAARNIIGDVSGSLQFSGNVPYPCTVYRPPIDSETAAPTCAANNNGGKAVAWGTVYVNSYCINTTRYSYVLDRQISTQPTTGQTYYALWRDSMTTNATCNPLDLTNSSAGVPSDSSTVSGSGRELVPPHMSLTNFLIQETPVGSGLFNLTVGLAYGDHDLQTVDAAGNVTCNGGPGQEYCGTSVLQTLLTRRLK